MKILLYREDWCGGYYYGDIYTINPPKDILDVTNYTHYRFEGEDFTYDFGERKSVVMEDGEEYFRQERTYPLEKIYMFMHNAVDGWDAPHERFAYMAYAEKRVAETWWYVEINSLKELEALMDKVISIRKCELDYFDLEAEL